MIGLIENGIQGRLKAVMDAAEFPYKLKKIDSYGGEFADGLERMVKDFPALLIAFSGGAVTKVGAGYRISCQFLLMCCSSNLRSEKASRHGDINKPGSYQIAEDALKILAGDKLGLEIDEIAPTRIRPLVNDKANQQLASVYALDIETGFYISGLEFMPDLGNFEIFHANWDVPTFGNVDKEIPSDDTADATDHVTLETE